MNIKDDDGMYDDQCSQCGFSIARSTETDDQVGRCWNCGHCENDNNFTTDPTKELNFNG